MLPDVTPVHKELAPSGLPLNYLIIIQRTFINLPFKAHTQNIIHAAVWYI